MSASNRSANHHSTIIEKSHTRSSYKPGNDKNASQRRFTAYSSNIKSSLNPGNLDTSQNRRRMTAIPESGTFKSFGKESAKPSFLLELEAKRGKSPQGLTQTTLIERKTETKRRSSALPGHSPSNIGNSMKLDLSGINSSIPDRNWGTKSSTVKKTETSSIRRSSNMPGAHSTIKKTETVTRTGGRGPSAGYPSGIGMSNPSMVTNLTFNNPNRSSGAVFDTDDYQPVTAMRYGKAPNRAGAKGKYSEGNPYPHAEDRKLIEEVNRRRGKEFEKRSYDRTPAAKKGGYGGLSTASGGKNSPNYFREETQVSKFDNGRRFEESKVIQRETY